MSKKYINFFLLFTIIAVAFATRFYKLGSIPEGFYVDEAGQGYSAYSILKTGKDEFGKQFPIVFRSLTDFKTPIYIYLITPLIPLFGLNQFTVRLPSFIFSVLTIPILYLLIKQKTNNNNLAILSCLLLAISPWHILFGRTNFECNVALFFYLTGIFTFYKGIEKPKYLILSAILFAIAIPAYHSQRIITPITVLYLFATNKRLLFDAAHKKATIISILTGTLITLPTLSIVNTPGFLARASGLNIFSHQRQMPDGFISGYNGNLNFIINGSWFLSVREFFALYFSYLSPRYMFWLGDYGPRSSFPELSTFFIWQLPFYIIGFLQLFTNKLSRDFRNLILLMLIVSPIPAAVTRDPYTTIRALPLVIPQILLIAIGVQHVASKLRNLKPLFYWGIASTVFVYSILKLYSSVVILNEYYRAKYWDWGWEKVVEVYKTLDNKLPVIVDNGRSDPDLQIAFFLKYDPSLYQSENKEVDASEYYTNLTRSNEKHIGNITTRKINWRNDVNLHQYLVADELGISKQQIEEHKLELISEIKYPDGTVAYRIVKTNPKK